MQNITWNNQCYQINGQNEFLKSGEVHYFRVPQDDLRRRLLLLKEAGGNCVATYIPWAIHELKEGEIVFGDVHQRDLEHYLALCKELGLYVICRPGPYQYTEMRYKGLPDWLCENYPEIHSVNIHGQTYDKSVVSYLHPTFLDKVKKWFDVVCPIIAKYTLPKGGPVAYVQFDNEMMGIHTWYGGSWDYNEVAMGIGQECGAYTKYCQQKYKTIDALNSTYDTDYQRFIDVRPSRHQHPTIKAERILTKDYQDFYFAQAAEYAHTLTTWMREYGIDCDFVHNSPNPASNSQFIETCKRLGNSFLLGSDHYYTLGPSWEQNNPTPQYAAKVFYSNEMLRLMGYPPTIFELPGGSSSDWPPVMREDFLCCYLTNVALGMKGFNYFIFTGGPNPYKCGATSANYDYGAAIGVAGDIRSIYKAQVEFGEFLKKNHWLTDAHLASDFYVALDWEYTRCSSYFGNANYDGFSSYDAWQFVVEGVLTSAFCASYTPEFIDNQTLVNADIKKPLFIPSSPCMDRDLQQAIVGFLERGGNIIICPLLPSYDNDFAPCTILKDYISSTQQILSSQHAPLVCAGDVGNIFANGKLFISSERPSEAEIIALDEISGYIAGWKITCPSGGQAIWFGLAWKHCMNEHLSMFKYLLSETGVKNNLIKCSNNNLWCTLRTDGSKSMLFVMNLYSAAMDTDIKIRKPNGEYEDLGSLSLSPMEVKTITIEG